MEISEKNKEFEYIYKDVIAKLFIFVENKGYEVKKTAYKELADKTYHYICIAKKEMRGRKRDDEDILKETMLDRHKLAACLCAAIIEVKPLIKANGKSTGIDYKYCNETFAVLVCMEVLKKAMVYEMAEEIKDTQAALKFKEKLYRDYRMQYPDYRYGDKTDYLKNMCYDMGNTHELCEHKDGECYHFDIFAYAKIFYHLEKHNRDIICDMFQEYFIVS